MPHRVVLGVDIGGSHITTALVDLSTRSLMADSLNRETVDSEQLAEEILTRWARLIAVSFKGLELPFKKIGVAIPGPFDYEQGISLMHEQRKFSALYQMNIREELSQRLGISSDSIRFINDAASFLKGEVYAGAAQHYDRVLGITLGTGLGSAFSLSGVTTDADLWNSAFRNGIAEDYLSTRWFVKRYQEHSGKDVGGVKELIALAKTDNVIYEIFREFAHNLADFIMANIAANEIACVVIGGNISNTSPLFLPALEARIAAEGFSTVVRISTLKENAALIGAASCWDL